MLRNRMIGEFFDPTLNGRIKVMQDFAAKSNLSLKSGILGLWFNDERPSIDSQSENIFNYSSENMYFTVMVWTGLIGLALLMAVMVQLLLKMIKGIRANPPDFLPSGLATGVFAGLAGYLVQAFIEGAFHVIPTGFVFWLLVGLGHVLTSEEIILKQKVVMGNESSYRA